MKGKFVELTTKQDGNNNPVLICLDDIAAIQAEGILAGNTKIILRGSGKAIQIPESFCDVKEKIFDAIDGKTKPKTERKRYEYHCNITYSDDMKNIQVLFDRDLQSYYGVVTKNDDTYVCIPLKYAGFNVYEPIEEKVKIIKKDEVK